MPTEQHPPAASRPQSSTGSDVVADFSNELDSSNAPRPVHVATEKSKRPWFFKSLGFFALLCAIVSLSIWFFSILGPLLQKSD